MFLNPNEIDLRRPSIRNMAFGHGVHFCLGAPLARLEARLLVPILLEQLEQLQPLLGEPVVIRWGLTGVIENLPVTFQAQR